MYFVLYSYCVLYVCTEYVWLITLTLYCYDLCVCNYVITPISVLVYYELAILVLNTHSRVSIVHD